MGVKHTVVIIRHDEGYGDGLINHLNMALRGKDMIAESFYPPELNPGNDRGPLEIQDEAMRQIASECLSDLWDTMELSSSHGDRQSQIQTQGSFRRYIHYCIYKYFGQTILGKDCPEKEVLT